MNNIIDGEIDKIIHEPARLKIMIFLYSVQRADFIYLMKHTGLTKGNLSSHLSKLQEEGYIDVIKEFIDNKIPCTMLYLTRKGRLMLQNYKKNMQDILNLID